MKRHVVLGTGGHIDHGKTALVKAMTGTDTDRLAEEKERGITIELGFAFLGDDITIIDVPGHERFLRTMVAGVSSVDIALFVVAADDGVMPQTIEHLDVLRYLNVKRGLIAITKADLVDEDWLALVIEDVRQTVAGTFLEGVTIIPTSAVTGQGVEEVKREIQTLAQAIPAHPNDHVFRFPVDRTFTMKGFGTVVTGTVLSGQVKVGDHLTIQPYEQDVRVRGLQVHESEVNQALAGQRTGINIMGMGKGEIERGAVLVEANYYKPSYMFDVRLHVSINAKDPIKHWQRVRFHAGTSEIYARVVPLEADEILPGQSGLAQLRLESPTIAEHHDRFVVRQYTPAITIGGGEILEPYPKKHRRLSPEAAEHLAKLEAGDPANEILSVFGYQPIAPLSLDEIQIGSRVQRDVLESLVEGLVGEGRLLQLADKMDTLYIKASDLHTLGECARTILHGVLDEYPFLDGVSFNELREGLKLTILPRHLELLLRTLEQQAQLCTCNRLWCLPTHQPQMAESECAVVQNLTSYFESHPFEVELDAQFFQKFGADVERTKRLFGWLESQGKVIRIGEGLYIGENDLNRGLDIVRMLGLHGNEIRIGDVRQQLDTTRKFAMPLMQYFDHQGITQRSGDIRIWRGEPKEEVCTHE